MIRKFFNKLYGNGVILAHLRGQRRVPYLPEEELRALRDARVRGIVRYAAQTVPYYQRLFQSEKVHPRDIRTVEDLNRLPFVDKDVVRKEPNLFVSTSRKVKKSIPFVTSGSTGVRLQVYHDPHSLLANFAFGEREREVVSRICGRQLGYRELHIGYPGSAVEKLLNFYEKATFIPVRPERVSLSVLEPVEHIAKAINRFRPDVIRSYGSYLETLFRVLALRGIQMHLPRMLIYGADSMTAGGRSLIEEKFGVPVHSIYNAVEAFKIGFSCEARRGFHLHDDLCYVRIVNGSGQKLASGEKGEVVICNLINRGTVLLNYRLGDIASLSTEKCSCGRTLPLLSELEGRVEDIIFLPDGKFVHPRVIWGVFKHRTEVLRYQLIQHEPERFELRLVALNNRTYMRVVGGILADLRRLLGDSVVIDSGYYKELEAQGAGKFRPVISLCKKGSFV